MSKHTTPGRLNIVNRDTFPNFKKSIFIPYRTKRRIRSVRAIHVDHDKRYAELKAKGMAIDITNPEIFVGNKKPLDGIFSPLFGADTTQDTPVYACECQRLTGASNLGRICPECGLPVRSIAADLRRTGYIDIAPYHILSYQGVKSLGKLLTTDGLNDILTTVKRIDRKGKIVDDSMPTIMDLYDDYEEVFEDRVGLPKGVIFMSKIPVFSARLRPLISYGASKSNVSMLQVNQDYMAITRLALELRATPILNMSRGTEIQRILNQIQASMISVYAHVEDQSNTKNGVFRKSLASGRVDYSSRMVITLDMGLMAHEIDLPYSTMVELYEEEIVNYLSKLEGISISQAIDQVEAAATVRSEKIINIITQLLKSNYGIWGIINRPPTISESSVQYVRVRKINDSPNDWTMHMPPDNLALLAADFDGDQLTYCAVKDPVFHPYFLNMCPTYAFIDRANGHFNTSMEFKKDYAAILSYGWDIDNALDAYLSNSDADAYELLGKLGVATTEVNENAIERRRDLLTTLMNASKDNKFRKRFVPELFYD